MDKLIFSSLHNSHRLLPVFLLCLFLPVCRGQSKDSDPEQKHPRAVCAETAWDFGEASPAQTLHHRFRIENRGGAALEFKGVRLSCASCFNAELSRTSVPPGEAAFLEVAFDLKNSSGRQHKTIFLRTNDPAHPFFVFRVGGTVSAVSASGTDEDKKASQVQPDRGPPAGNDTLQTWIIFTSPGCPDCEWFRKHFLPETASLSRSPMPRLLAVDINTVDGYKMLLAAEKQHGRSGEGSPVLYAVGRLYHGRKEISSAQEVLLEAVNRERPANTELPSWFREGQNLAKPLDQITPPVKNDAHGDASSEKPDYRHSRILVFEKPGCGKCDRMRRRIRHLRTVMPELSITLINTADDPENRLLQFAIATQAGIPEKQRLAVPMAVSGNDYLYGDITDSALKTLAENAQPEPFWRTWDETQRFEEAQRALTTLSGELTLGMLALAGLADGINPCAFAAIVFLVSCLAVSHGRSRFYILGCGLLFCLGVFLFYYMLGLGFLQFAAMFRQREGLQRVLFRAGAAVCFLFGVLGIRDAVAAYLKGAGAMKFGMPKAFTAVTHRMMRSVRHPGFMLPAALLLGFAVSAVETVCTGQIYFPVLLLLNRSAAGVRPALLLLLYNICFLIPMLAVTVLCGLGLSTKPVSDWARRHSAASRLAAAALILGVGAMLLYFSP